MERRISKSPVSGEETVPVGGPFSPAVIPLIALVLFGLHLTGIARFLPPSMRFLLASVTFFIWPGDIVMRHLFRWKPAGLPLRFLLAICTGISLHSLAAFMCTIAGMPFTVFMAVMQAVLLLLYILYGWRTLRARRTGPVRAFSLPFFERWSTAIMASSIAIALWLFLAPGPIQPAGDAYDHIGYARRIVAGNDLSPADVVAPAAGAAAVERDPRKGTLHPILALWSAAAGIDPALLWLYLPVVLAPAAFIAFLMFSAVILPGGGYVLAAALLFLCFQGGIGREFFGTIAYGQNLSLVFLWTIAGFAISFLARNRSLPVVLLLFLAAGAGAVHIGFMIQFVLLLLSLLLLVRYLGWEWRSLWRFTWPVALTAAVLFSWKFAAAYGEANLMHTHHQGVLWLWDHLFVVSPVEIVRRYGLAFFGGIVLLPGLLLVRRHVREARICIALSLLPVLICFNPLVAPFVYDRATYLLHRLVLNIPAFQAIVLIAGISIARARRGSPPVKLAAVAGVFLWVKLFLLPGAGALAAALGPASNPGGRETVAEPFTEVIEAAAAIPDGSVVLSDPLTSYALSAFRNLEVVSVLHQHGNPNDPLVMERLAACRDVLSPFVTQRESMRRLERFRVGYIVVNGAYRRPVHEFMADWSSVFFNPLRNKFSGPRDNFSVVYASDQVLVVKVLGYFLGTERWIPTIPYLDSDTRGLHECGSQVAGCGVRISRMAVAPRRILPGERVRFRIQYEAGDMPETPFPVLLIVRFDNKDYISRFSGYPGGKLVRRMAERTGGYLSRFRIDRRIFNGFYPPALWPIGATVTEEFEVVLPDALKEGTYGVELSFACEPLLPNFSLRDFLYNADSFSGAMCDTIEVTKSLVR